MNNELLNVLDFIERERGINKDILIKAVESSIVSAARKCSKEIAIHRHLSAHIDQKTGEIKVFSDLTVVEKDTIPNPDEISLVKAKAIQKNAKVQDIITVEVTPENFGRIAAQTAKQIIIQKLKEAEHNLLFDEFKDRIGDIATGVIRKKEKGNFIVDMGRTEAVLPYKEQSAAEHYHVGSRIKAYIVDVKPTHKGPEILLSRTHIGLLKRLFTLEVPEIAEGIVEIKKIVREPGCRAKIAVHSNNTRVDPVGACVGMRGSRIKNIVMELEPEKLDIVKWESDIKLYVKNALSPAKLQDIIVKEKERKLLIMVAEDQLSIAIGKLGQNVRLASKLTGWGIDIRKAGEEKKNIEEKAAETEPATKSKSAPKPKDTQEAGNKGLISKLKISPVKADVLIQSGLDTIDKIAGADISELIKIKGFGQKTASKIKEKAQTLKEGKE